MMMSSKCAFVAVTVFALLLTHGGVNVVEARRTQSNQRKTSSPSSSNSGHVTQPSYNTHNNGGAGNTHADVAKLSYPNYNSQPNRPATGTGNANSNNAAIGWNVPQGPPPAYSASNPVGGAKTNMHEQPPSYHAPNYGAAPPSYGAAAPSYGASNVHQPISATQNHGQTYAGYPSGGTYQTGGHMPGGYYPGAAAPPPGATVYQQGAALPPGAILYSQPPQQSSGSGFGTGLLAGGLGGALIGHALTPSGGSSSQAAAAAPAAAGGTDRIIIINNGVPVNATDGTTVINAAGQPMNTTDVAAAPAPLAPLAPMDGQSTMPANGTDAAAPPPPTGRIICVPTKVNETDPTDSSKMIEVEKVACYPEPPPPAAAPGEGPAPLAPMAPAQPGSQQVQPPGAVPPDQAAVRANASSGASAVLRTIDGSLLAMVILFSALFMRNYAN
ncbi:formin-like protein 7 [Scaptodrosophila lebanonensis]|uniref:Formin-like protein 7 n=1 Tax=Drosophila lebanonensis TaxID=7225 RepID=A0A6J2TTU2_DROLE|nr:formin-like protein 7 [Scaptodrosophila lebanonensis]